MHTIYISLERCGAAGYTVIVGYVMHAPLREEDLRGMCLTQDVSLTMSICPGS